MKSVLLIAVLLGMVQVIDVPQGDGDPVMLDGRFSPGEWDDAREVVVDDSVRLYVKQYRDHVFIGLRTPWSMLATTDLFVQAEPGVVYNLHASAQLGERRLTDTLWTDWEPAWHWGNAVDWYANELRFDRLVADSILRADSTFDRTRLRFRTTYAYDGYEFQIRRSRFPGREWRIRVEARATVPNQTDRVFPRASTRHQPATWTVLRF
jgi:hypothetical protein